MRTTVTLDPDTRLLIERAMRERGIGFKDALNDAVRAGLAGRRADDATETTVPFAMGIPVVELDGALRVAAQLEDDVLVRRLEAGR